MKNARYLSLLVIVVALAGACRSGTQVAACRVQTDDGPVQGADLGASCAFLGIPFAAPPIGTLRWKAPQPVVSWGPGLLDATTTPPHCPIVEPPGTGETSGRE